MVLIILDGTCASILHGVHMHDRSPPKPITLSCICMQLQMPYKPAAGGMQMYVYMLLAMGPGMLFQLVPSMYTQLTK